MLGILADSQIRALCEQHKMIEPFESKAIREVTVETLKGSIVAGGGPADVGRETKKIISYGMSGYGYDIRVADDFKIFKNVHCVEIDPKRMDERAFETVSAAEKGGFVHVPPNSFMLARSIEYFRIPRNVLAVVLGKSTYARCGIIVNCTPAEPEWEGHLTIEISNTTPLPARIYANEGIAQMLFYAGDAVCEVSYKDKGGKYDKQGAQIVLPKV